MQLHSFVWTRWLPLVATALVPATSASQDAGESPAGLAKVGECVPDHAFAALDGHDGRSALAQLRGQPVLVVG
jgi:hypothetical protein